MAKRFGHGRVRFLVLACAFVFVCFQSPLAQAVTEIWVDSYHGTDNDYESGGRGPGTDAFKSIHHTVKELFDHAGDAPFIVYITATGIDYSVTAGGETNLANSLGIAFPPTPFPETSFQGYLGRPVISGDGATSAGWDTAFYIQGGSNNLTFTNLQITGFPNGAIYANPTSGSLTIKDCRINSNENNTITQPYGAIHLRGPDNSVSGCEIDGNYGEGIRIQGSNNTLSGCSIHGNVFDQLTGGQGAVVIIEGGTGNIVKGNTVYDTGGASVYCPGIQDNSDTTTIADNTIYWSGDSGSSHQNYGIETLGDNTTISGNTIYGHNDTGYVGIYCYDATNLTVTGNRIFDNTTGLELISHDEDIAPEVTRNKIYSNQDWGIRATADNAHSLSPKIENNLIHGNTSGGVKFTDNVIDCLPVFYHNTIDGSSEGNGIEIAATGNNTLVTVKYNIITNYGKGLVALPGTSTELDYNDVWGNTTANYEHVFPEANDISLDPKYGSYTLRPDSPCMDAIPDSAGTASPLISPGIPAPWARGKDMGCYESEGYEPKLIVVIYPEDRRPGSCPRPEGIDCPDGACREFFDKDDTVTLTAAPAGGNRFDHWEGEVEGIENPDTLIMGKNDSTVTAVFTPTSHTENIPAGMEAADYVMYSVPLEAGDASPEGFFGIGADEYDPARHRIGRWSPNAGEYKEFPRVGSVRPGYTYWLLMADGMDLSASGEATPLTDDPLYGLPSCKIPVYKGWNMVGNPFQYPVSLSNAVASFGWIEPGPFVGRRLLRLER